MPIITEPKKLSMPQQVQKNKEDIESIFKKIDGLDATDNVVVVPDMSYVLSADELKSVRQPVAFIVYDNQLFIKKKEENGNAYFNLVFSIAVSTVVSFESKQIEVNLTNGALGITLATVNTYSVSQIDSKFPTALYVDNALAQKASLSGANFTGPITAPSIIENMTGYSFDMSSRNPNVTYDDIFAGVVKNGNKLTVVIAVNVTRLSSGVYEFRLGAINVPSEIYSKLYPTNIGGVSLLNNITAMATKNTALADKITFGAYIQKTGGKIAITISDAANFAINDTYYVRIEQTFLLSNNLAQ